jgi:hypothetical protein
MRKHIYIGNTGLKDSVGKLARMFDDIHIERVCYARPVRYAGDVYKIGKNLYAVYNCNYKRGYNYVVGRGRFYCYRRAIISQEQLIEFAKKYNLNHILQDLQEVEP